MNGLGLDDSKLKPVIKDYLRGMEKIKSVSTIHVCSMGTLIG
jgi:hypothetical protein